MIAWAILFGICTMGFILSLLYLIKLFFFPEDNQEDY